MSLWISVSLSILSLLAVSLPLTATPAGASFESHPTFLIINMLNTPTLPRNFRTASTAYANSSTSAANNPTRKGLNTLRISGSAQFSEEGLKALITALKNPSKLVIVDLREESHGFANGIAISWFAPKNWINAGKSRKQIEEDENRRLANLLKEKEAVFYTILEKDVDDTIKEKSAQTIEVKSVANESQVVDSQHADYVRICVRDHLRPTDLAVEQFVTFIDTLNPETWIHFHCSAGRGRTTTFMAMYDMMQNANDVSFKDILVRQCLIGGTDLAHHPDINSWKYPYGVERLQFLRRFYEFCKTRSQEGKKNWTNIHAGFTSTAKEQ